MCELIEKKNRLFKTQEVSFFTDSDGLLCDECDSKIVKDNGELICGSCGLVAENIYETNTVVEIEIPIRKSNLDGWMQKAVDRKVVDPRTKLGSFF
jgi:hypothetical protein